MNHLPDQALPSDSTAGENALRKNVVVVGEQALEDHDSTHSTPGQTQSHNTSNPNDTNININPNSVIITVKETSHSPPSPARDGVAHDFGVSPPHRWTNQSSRFPSNQSGSLKAQSVDITSPYSTASTVASPWGVHTTSGKSYTTSTLVAAPVGEAPLKATMQNDHNQRVGRAQYNNVQNVYQDGDGNTSLVRKNSSNLYHTYQNQHLATPRLRTTSTGLSLSSSSMSVKHHFHGSVRHYSVGGTTEDEEKEEDGASEDDDEMDCDGDDESVYASPGTWTNASTARKRRSYSSRTPGYSAVTSMSGGDRRSSSYLRFRGQASGKSHMQPGNRRNIQNSLESAPTTLLPMSKCFTAARLYSPFDASEANSAALARANNTEVNVVTDENDVALVLPTLEHSQQTTFESRYCHMLPVMHDRAVKLVDLLVPFAPTLEYAVRNFISSFNIPGVSHAKSTQLANRPLVWPRPLPAQLVSPSYISFASAPNSAGVSAPVPHTSLTGQLGKLGGCSAPTLSQLPALRIYSNDYSYALRGEYGFDHHVTSLHFRLRHSGVPHADCAAIPFLSPSKGGFQLPYVWSTYPHFMERYPFWLWRQPQQSLESGLVQERVRRDSYYDMAGDVGEDRHHDDDKLQQERGYKSWDFRAAKKMAWTAAGRDASIKAMIAKGLVVDLNNQLKPEETIQDFAAIETVEKLDQLAMIERQGQVVLSLLLGPRPLPFKVVVLLPHILLIPLFFGRWLITWMVLLLQGTLSMEPALREQQAVELADRLGDMVSRGLTMTMVRVTREQQLRREKQRFDEKLAEIQHRRQATATTTGNENPGRRVGSGTTQSASAAKNATSVSASGAGTAWEPEPLPSYPLGMGGLQEWLTQAEHSNVATSVESVYATEVNDCDDRDMDWIDQVKQQHALRRRSVNKPAAKLEHKGAWWILGGEAPTEADFVVFGFLATTLATPTQPHIAHLLQGYPVLIEYMSRIHEDYFPDFTAPEIVPNPSESLWATAVYHMSTSGFKSCVANVVKYTFHRAVENKCGEHEKPEQQPSTLQLEKAQANSRAKKLLSPLPSQINSSRYGVGTTTTAHSSRPARYYAQATKSLSMALSKAIEKVPVIDFSVSIRNRASRANILQMGSTDGLMFPLGSSTQKLAREGAAMPGFLLQGDHSPLLSAGDWMSSQQQEAMARSRSFSLPQVLPGGGRIVGPEELPPSPPMTYSLDPSSNTNSSIPNFVLDSGSLEAPELRATAARATTSSAQEGPSGSSFSIDQNGVRTLPKTRKPPPTPLTTIGAKTSKRNDTRATVAGFRRAGGINRTATSSPGSSGDAGGNKRGFMPPPTPMHINSRAGWRQSATGARAASATAVLGNTHQLASPAVPNNMYNAASYGPDVSDSLAASLPNDRPLLSSASLTRSRVRNSSNGHGQMWASGANANGSSAAGVSPEPLSTTRIQFADQPTNSHRRHGGAASDRTTFAGHNSSLINPDNPALSSSSQGQYRYNQHQLHQQHPSGRRKVSDHSAGNRNDQTSTAHLIVRGGGNVANNGQHYTPSPQHSNNEWVEHQTGASTKVVGAFVPATTETQDADNSFTKQRNRRRSSTAFVPHTIHEVDEESDEDGDEDEELQRGRKPGPREPLEAADTKIHKKDAPAKDSPSQRMTPQSASEQKRADAVDEDITSAHKGRQKGLTTIKT